MTHFELNMVVGAHFKHHGTHVSLAGAQGSDGVLNADDVSHLAEIGLLIWNSINEDAHEANHMAMSNICKGW